MNGSYTFELEADYQSLTSDPDVVFTLVVGSSCANDYIQSATPIDDFKFYILSDPTEVLFSNFLHAKKNCPYVVTLTQIQDSSANDAANYIGPYDDRIVIG